MREVFAEVENWRKEGKSIAIATNVKREGNSLRPLGAKMAMTNTQGIAGSVTGGCIEGVVYEEAQTVIKTGVPKLLHYGVIRGENPWEVGLTCGSSLDVFVEPLDSPAWHETYPAIKTCIEENRLAAVATVITGAGLGKKFVLWSDGRTLGSLGNGILDTQAKEWMQKQTSIQEPNWTSFTIEGEQIEVFVDILAPSERLMIIGAVHIAVPLVTLAKTLGFHTIVIDPRSAFATHERFPHVDELIIEWPSDALEKLRVDEGTYVAVISHDDKLDYPALKVALTNPARYVGVLGSRKKAPTRAIALKEMGVTDEQLAKLHGPIGINIGATLPDEIALSILAEMIAARHGLPKS